MTTVSSAALPVARGPISATVAEALSAPPAGRPLETGSLADADPLGDDVQLALHLCYELHYQGLPGVDASWEWDPGLLRLRAQLEGRFLTALRAAVAGGDDVDAEFAALLVEPVDAHGVSHFLRDEGEWWHVRELFAHRSIYHLKEADPHAWVIPRLRGRAKAALVAVEFDEFGGGRAEFVHSRLFADLLRGAGLPDGYLALLDRVPAPMPAIVNMMSLFGLHRALRGALVGHFAAAEVTTAPSAQRMVQALTRLGAPEACKFFYAEHVEADAVHEQVMRHDVVGDLLAQDPSLAADVVFGVQATNFLEDRLGEHLLTCWRAGRSSLLQPLS
ncbi:iron-containing redox enzyme family protein [Amycolatopsis sp. FDAARGOS 1241]|uniref:iron-containing redox enzyme family protein n=1 Tax=Amycolatopsis sp. FDAARGOS 1241 TaxID=2778070 RepID=UPI0019528096|nr:iron-containing redox enzyme family protein [Amycolatopsis sp. FDAARGOS 1241]QRP49689.1 iron-containing redox enzyme family protein [Amycolatopsis sp. FDAARGOS 1241]